MSAIITSRVDPSSSSTGDPPEDPLIVDLDPSPIPDNQVTGRKKVVRKQVIRRKRKIIASKVDPTPSSKKALPQDPLTESIELPPVPDNHDTEGKKSVMNQTLNYVAGKINTFAKFMIGIPHFFPYHLHSIIQFIILHN